MIRAGTIRAAARLLLAALLVVAGIAHLTFARAAFAAMVPAWLPVGVDTVVVASGVVEIVLGAALAGLPRWRVALGWTAAALFVVVFVGNVTQLLNRADAFGLDSDVRRAVRLAFQPLLIGWALWCTGAWAAWRARRRRDRTAPATG